MSARKIRFAVPGDEASIADLLTCNMEPSIVALNVNIAEAEHLRSDVSFLAYLSAMRWIAQQSAVVAEVNIKRFPTIVGVGSLSSLDPNRKVNPDEVDATGGSFAI